MVKTRSLICAAVGVLVVPFGACVGGGAGKGMIVTQPTAPPNMVFEVHGVV